MVSGPKYIQIKGAREHNLKNITVDIPRNKFVVITGPSGSGKSSLAFDTIYAEGQRRYVESLSSYARQFLDQLSKPNVDSIEGLSPSISIEQKTIKSNPRSTVGTITEIYDFLRLLFSRVAIPYSYVTGKPMVKQNSEQIAEQLLKLKEGTKVFILAPIVRDRKGEYKKELHNLRQSGFVRVKIDGQIYDLGQSIKLDKNKKHSIDVFIDRLKIKKDILNRLTDSIDNAIKLSDGIVSIETLDEKNVSNIRVFSTKLACPESGVSYPDLEPKLFSFNSPVGACPDCRGLGMKEFFSPPLIIPDPTLSLSKGAIAPWSKNPIYTEYLERLSEIVGFSMEVPFKELPAHSRQLLLEGTDKTVDISFKGKNKIFGKASKFEGIIASLESRFEQAKKEEDSRKIDFLRQFMSQKKCESCNGLRLRKETLHIKISGKNIAELSEMNLLETQKFLENLNFSGNQKLVADKVLKEIQDRLQFLLNVGLSYLTLNRGSGTLSGGEAQRIRLATQIGSSLMGVLYVLDEPSIGLHPRDNDQLVNTLKKLRDLGNSVLVVEHDEKTMLESDFILDLGPGSGKHGGELISFGTPQLIMDDPKSITGQYLSKKKTIIAREARRISSDYLSMIGCHKHNLKNINVDIPLGIFTCITGVSGSGKSTLILELLFDAICDHFTENLGIEGIQKISGADKLDKLLHVNQNPIGRTPRSNPATYSGVFTSIRDLFSSLPESKIRGYKPGRFSFNVKGGRCEECQGDGSKKIEMHFLPDVFVQCEVCKGSRYNRDTLEIYYKGKNISEVLNMSIQEACDFFQPVPAIQKILQTMVDVGLGYVTLGQSATTLSGGEAQRLKLSKELSKRDTGKTLYILDEPSTGLHFEDINLLLSVLHKLVDQGNTVVVIEHNLDIINSSDWVVDLGPEGGDRGGEIIATGTPEEIASNPLSVTGRYLNQIKI